MKETAYDIFMTHFQPDEKGWTPIIKIEDLVQISDKFKSNNGCQWARKGSRLDKEFIVKRFHANEMGGSGNKVVAVQLQGKRVTIENHSIPEAVRKVLKNKPCVVLGVLTTDMEIDHKNGKYNAEKWTIEDFQPLCKAANDAKREHCKRCNACHKRFDATQIGFPKSFTKGNEDSDYCEGCFWYDPVAFRKDVYNV